MPIVSSQYWNSVHGATAGEARKDEEGMQTMRTLANNMAWMLKKFQGIATTESPEREAFTPMHFIR